MPSNYGKRCPRPKNKRGAPILMPRKLPPKQWTAVTVRSHTYTMIRELSDYWDICIGDVINACVEKEFKKILWEQEHAKIVQKVGKYVPRA